MPTLVSCSTGIDKQALVPLIELYLVCVVDAECAKILAKNGEGYTMVSA